MRPQGSKWHGATRGKKRKENEKDLCLPVWPTQCTESCAWFISFHTRTFWNTERVRQVASCVLGGLTLKGRDRMVFLPGLRIWWFPGRHWPWRKLRRGVWVFYVRKVPNPFGSRDRSQRWGGVSASTMSQWIVYWVDWVVCPLESSRPWGRRCGGLRPGSCPQTQGDITSPG